MPATVAFGAYLLAGIGFCALSLLLIFSWRGNFLSGVFLLATTLTGLWALALAFSPEVFTASPHAFVISEGTRYGAWTAFFTTVLLRSDRSGRNIALFAGANLVWIGLVAYAAITLLGAGSLRAAESYALPGLLLAVLVAIMTFEQLVRNASDKSRAGLAYFALAVGLILAYDLFMFSQAVLVGAIQDWVWASRGFAYVAAVPLLAIGVQRVRAWSVGIFVSRAVVVHSASLIGIGTYLLLMSIAGYLLRTLHATWGPVIQVVFFAGALTVLLYVLFSDRALPRFKVFINKHFFENKYDYREEWLRLIRSLATPEPGLTIGERSVKALADIVGSDGGILLTRNESDDVMSVANRWGTDANIASLPLASHLIRFLEDRFWVIDRQRPDEVPAVVADEINALIPPQCRLIVPIQAKDSMYGLVLLSDPAIEISLNYEDHDLLKTVGQQIAMFLQQEHATLLLAESRQFEAFNKMVAFVMHDLKNLIAQQSLMLQNAEKHKSNPRFVDDMFATVANSVSRMQGLLQQLTARSSSGENQRVHVASIVQAAIDASSDRKPAPVLELADASCEVEANRERLVAVLQHLIRNAQDATPATGSIRVHVGQANGDSVITVADSGSGMTDEFVRTTLFRPFHSTKGSQGMGIGAYQAREFARSTGGDIVVDSTVGEGTSVTLRIPQC